MHRHMLMAGKVRLQGQQAFSPGAEASSDGAVLALPRHAFRASANDALLSSSLNCPSSKEGPEKAAPLTWHTISVDTVIYKELLMNKLSGTPVKPDLSRVCIPKACLNVLFHLEAAVWAMHSSPVQCLLAHDIPCRLWEGCV